LIAEVIIDRNIPGLDKAFDYIIPKELWNILKIGHKVVVPFGKGIIEGYVIKIKIESDIPDSKLKQLKRISHKEPLLSDLQLELIKWMRDHYFCKYFDAVRCIVPSAFGKKKAAVYKLLEGDDFSRLNDEEINQYMLISQGTKEIEKDSLTMEEIRLMESLVKKGYAKKLQYNLTDKLNNTIPMVKLLNHISIGKISKEQKKVINILLRFHEMPLNDLIREAGISKGPINTLLKKGMIEISVKEIIPSDSSEPSSILVPTEEQKNVIESIKEAFDKNRKVLLHGQTGSGKTLVYFYLLKSFVEKGRKGLLLVPEISLTHQIIKRAREFFGDRLAIFHSGMTPKDKYTNWRKIIENKVDVIIGVRSAVFLPIEPLGLIIMDEEHDDSYKQSDLRPKYSTVEVAEQRSTLENTRILLGSATPSTESYQKVQLDQYKLVELNNRIFNSTMPKVEIIDMREELKRGNKSIISDKLKKEMDYALDNNLQVLLFLNRRGYSTFILCRSCGEVIKCPHCDVSLKYHDNPKHLSCHYCSYKDSVKDKCPSCGSHKIRFFGTGTEKIEKEIKQLFPGKNILRLDRDTARKKGSMDNIINEMEKGRGDILIGTQMITKGLDFANLYLVGVISADTSLNISDYRSGEKTFQLLYQVAGRAGRRDTPGKVIIQTYNPNNYSIKAVKEYSYSDFILKELEFRQSRGYPPFGRFITITISGRETDILQKRTFDIYKEILSMDIKAFDPVKAQIYKLKSFFRHRILVKLNENQLERENQLREYLQKLISTNNSKEILIDIELNSFGI
jgi:primosomal protein N' (replication factor Y)